MKIVKEFSRFASEYDKYNVIQKEVAKRLISYVPKGSYFKVLDLGSGDGIIYKYFMQNGILVKHFVALDFSKKMLELHPSKKNIQKLCIDFNTLPLDSPFKEKEFDLLLSSSALQWSSNLELLLSSIKELSSNFYFSFFTANTFRTLHQTAKIESPIYSKEDILSALDKVFIYEAEVERYQLSFDSVYEMLRYIKRSGVNGGVKQLSFREIKEVILNYPLNYLEFEVLFIKVREKK